MRQKKKGYLKNNGQKCFKFNALNIPRSKHMHTHIHTHKPTHLKSHYNHIAESVINKKTPKSREVSYIQKTRMTIKSVSNPEHKGAISVSTEILKGQYTIFI